MLAHLQFSLQDVVLQHYEQKLPNITHQLHKNSPKKCIFHYIRSCTPPTEYKLEKTMNVRRIVRLQKQWLILVFLFGYHVNLPALYSMSMLPFDSPPIPFPIYCISQLTYLTDNILQVQNDRFFTEDIEKYL